jgi:hypothetical protein
MRAPDSLIPSEWFTKADGDIQAAELLEVTASLETARRLAVLVCRKIAV